MILRNQHKESLIDGTFKLSLILFQLIDVQKTDRIVAEGHGNIKQIGKKAFHYELFYEKDKYSVPFNDQSICDDNGDFHFVGVDSEGVKWSFKSYLYGHRYLGQQSTLLQLNGETTTLNFESKADFEIKEKRTCLKYVIPTQYELPCNASEKYRVMRDDIIIEEKYLNSVQYKSPAFEIEGRYESKSIDLTFKFSEYNERYDNRIIESLKFISGQQIEPIIKYKYTGRNISGSFYPFIKKGKIAKIESPIDFGSLNSKSLIWSWKLFEKFFLYIKDSKNTNYSSLGTEVNGLVGLSNSFFETQLLVIGVRVEGIVKILFPKLANPTKAQLNSIDQLIGKVKQLDFNDQYGLINRTVSAIGSMKKSRVKDKLIKMRDLGIINQNQYTAWDNLRNSSAHANRGTSEGWYTESTERYYSVLEMIYRIIFDRIKYSGEYTCYSKTDRPKEKYKRYKSKA